MTEGLPTHTPDGWEIAWSFPPPADPDAEPMDISGWTPLGATEEGMRSCPVCGALGAQKHDLGEHIAAGTLNTRPRGVVIRDSNVPPFPATYETRP